MHKSNLTEQPQNSSYTKHIVESGYGLLSSQFPGLTQ